MLKKIIKFGITGGLGTISNLVLFFVFSDLLKFNPKIVSIFCFIICCTQNYFINHIWTFKVENTNTKPSFKLWTKFLLASFLGFVVNFSVLNLLLYTHNWSFTVIPQGIGIFCGMIFNFLSSNFFVFRKKEEEV